VPLNVLLLGYAYGKGGIQTHTHYLAEGLRARGHRVTTVTPQRIASYRHSLAFPNAPPPEIYSSMSELARIVRRVRPDVAVMTGTGWKAMAGMLATPRPCRRIFFEVMSGKRKGPLDPRDLVHLGFHAIVGQGNGVTRRFVQDFKWKGPRLTIPALPEPLERKHEIPRKRPRAPGAGPVRFVYFGRLAPHKNVRLLAQSFRDYAPEGSTLDIWGGGADADAVAEVIAEAGLHGQVRLRGRYPDGAAYIELLQSYDLKLLPTVGEEGAPLVLLEAMACGLPFVANGVGGIPDYSNQDCAITGGDIAEFVPAVRAMVARLQRGEIDPARLQAHYDNNFNFNCLMDRWEGFLRAIVNSPLRTLPARSDDRPTADGPQPLMAEHGRG